jgi:hypothetical protein
MKITTHEQYYNLLGMVQNLCSLTHLNLEEADQLDKLSSDVEEYEKLHFPIYGERGTTHCK